MSWLTGAVFSVEVSPQPLPLSSESALQLYPGTQNSLALGCTQVSYSQPSTARNRLPKRQLIHQDLQRGQTLNQEMHITNNNGEFSGALLVSGLQVAIKKAQRESEVFLFQQSRLPHCREEL